MRGFYTIRQSDVGARTIKCFGRTFMVTSIMGRVFSTDVGKRIYMSGDVPQVENDEQRDARLARNGD